MQTFVFRSEIDARASEVFAWHRSPEALRTLIPPWEPVMLERAPAALANGEVAVLAIRIIGPIKLRWIARHRDVIDRGEAGGEFTDVQERGPFASWVHRHLVRPAGPGRCVLEDQITCALPLGRVSELLVGWYLRRRLTRLFAYRHDATRAAVTGPSHTDLQSAHA
jgi:ligand-binding SRPBCC domain-containing protein